MTRAEYDKDVVGAIQRAGFNLSVLCGSTEKVARVNAQMTAFSKVCADTAWNRHPDPEHADIEQLRDLFLSVFWERFEALRRNSRGRA